MIKLWDKLPNYQPRSPQGATFKPQGNMPPADPTHDRNFRDDPSLWNQGRGGMGRGFRPPGYGRPFGRNQGNWQWQGQSYSTPRHANKGPRFPGTPISTQGMHMNPHLAAAFSPLYVAPVMQGMQQSSPRHNMFPHAQSHSPGQNMSPVMILQRGGGSSGKSQNQSNTPSPTGQK